MRAALKEAGISKNENLALRNTVSKHLRRVTCESFTPDFRATEKGPLPSAHSG